MTNPGLGWFQLTRIYNDEAVFMKINLWIMWLTRHPGCK